MFKMAMTVLLMTIIIAMVMIMMLQLLSISKHDGQAYVACCERDYDDEQDDNLTNDNKLSTNLTMTMILKMMRLTELCH